MDPRTQLGERRFGRRAPALPVVDREWVGGRVTMPGLLDASEPQPELVLWVELPDDRIVSTAVVAAGAPASFADVLRDAMHFPDVDLARRPSRIRVADAGLAAELGDAPGDAAVSVAATPELDAHVEYLRAAVRGDGADDGSYLGGGAIDEPLVAALFAASAALFRSAPWELIADYEIVRIDVPALDVDGAVLSVSGPPGEARGFVLFPSLDDYDAWLDAADDLDDGYLRVDFGSATLALDFERRDDLPDPMRRETSRHGWPVAAASAYPRVEYRDRYGMSLALAADDVRLATACALALPAFAAEHEAWLRDEGAAARAPAGEPDRAAGVYDVGGGIEVRVEANRDEWPLPVQEPFRRGGPKVGRNDPCPCGSGRKYKKCCLNA